MSLVRYRGPLRSLRGTLGRLLPDGRARLRGETVTVALPELERPWYWYKADGAWSGPYRSWEACASALTDLLTIWGCLDTAARCREAEASVDGWTDYAGESRVMIRAGSFDSPANCH